MMISDGEKWGKTVWVNDREKGKDSQARWHEYVNAQNSAFHNAPTFIIKPTTSILEWALSFAKAFRRFITITSFFIGKLLIPMGVVRSISPPSMSQMLSPEKPLVIVVSPVFDLWNFGSSFDDSSDSSCCFWMITRPVMMMRQRSTQMVTEMMRYR